MSGTRQAHLNVHPRALARRRRFYSRGMALPVALLIASMMLTTAAAWFEASNAASHDVASIADQLRAFHAADSALTLCADTAANSSGSDRPTTAGEPAGWKSAATFDALASTPVPAWPGAARPPQCVVEPWRLGSRPEARAFLVTARGYGRSLDTQAWLQLELAVEDGHVERHWRRVAARPY